MSDGTWEMLAPEPQIVTVAIRDRMRQAAAAQGFKCLTRGIEPDWGAHWSPCDEGCRHDAVVVDGDDFEEREAQFDAAEAAGRVRIVGRTEASWRQVDVRTLGWPHDLRPERLSILCLRCWAARS